MNREEFLRQLKLALEGKVSSQVIQENVNYYRKYINEQVQSGKSEAEVLYMLGDPRLLAKTIEGSSKFSSNAGEGQSFYSDTSHNGYYESTYSSGYERSTGNDYGHNNKKTSFTMPSWLISIIVILVIFVVLTLVVKVFAFFAPLILMMMLVGFVGKVLSNWIGR